MPLEIFRSKEPIALCVYIRDKEERYWFHSEESGWEQALTSVKLLIPADLVSLFLITENCKKRSVLRGLNNRIIKAYFLSLIDEPYEHLLKEG